MCSTAQQYYQWANNSRITGTFTSLSQYRFPELNWKVEDGYFILTLQYLPRTYCRTFSNNHQYLGSTSAYISLSRSVLLASIKYFYRRVQFSITDSRWGVLARYCTPPAQYWIKTNYRLFSTAYQYYQWANNSRITRTFTSLSQYRLLNWIKQYLTSTYWRTFSNNHQYLASTSA